MKFKKKKNEPGKIQQDHSAKSALYSGLQKLSYSETSIME